MPRAATAALVPEQGAPFTFTNVMLDDPRPDEVVVRMVAAGKLPLDRLVERFAFADIEKAAEASHRGEVLKPVLTFA